MYKIMKYFFWGLLLITFNVSLGINGFKMDVLPDIIGYILIGLAFWQLAQKNSRFEKGIICVGLSLLTHVIQLVIGENIEVVGLFGLILLIGTTALRLGYLYYMHEAVNDIIDENKEMGVLNTFKENNITNWKVILILGLISSTLVALSMLGSEIILMISIIPTIGMGIMQIVFLVIIYRVKKQFEIEQMNS